MGAGSSGARLAAVSSGCYGAGAIEMALALTPVDQRSPSLSAARSGPLRTSAIRGVGRTGTACPVFRPDRSGLTSGIDRWNLPREDRLSVVKQLAESVRLPVVSRPSE